MIEMDQIHGLIDRATARMTPSPIMRLGLSPADVRAAIERQRPMTADEIRRAFAKRVRKQSVGRNGLPAHVVDAMYRDYQRLQSLQKVGEIYNRTRQAMFGIFQTHGLKMNERKFHKTYATWDGRDFTPGKDGYLRATSGDRRMLHYLVWEAAGGTVPLGYQLTFKDGNRWNCSVDNLVCAPIAVVTRMHSTGHNQATPKALRKIAFRIPKPNRPPVYRS